MDFTEVVASEFQQDNAVARTSLQTSEGIYTISTCKLYPLEASSFALLGADFFVHPDDHRKSYETMLFLDGAPASYPFGTLPGNTYHGAYQRYWTEREAQAGHRTFIEQVQRVLSKQPGKASTTVYATVYRNGTNWEARILEPGKDPYFWAPPGTTMVRRIGLEAGIRDSYHAVRFVDELSFALLASGTLKAGSEA